MRRTLCVLMLAVAFFAAPAVSQQPTQRQVDSLAAQVRQLRARLDSLLRVLGRQPAAPAAAPVGDDLAALRAAASQAAGGGLSDTTRSADTLTQAVGRERNQAQLNPEIGVTTFLGEDGLSGTGISLYRAFGGLGTHELTAQVTRSASDSELFGNGGRPTYLLHLLNFWQLNHSTYMQIGGTGLFGTDPDSALRTTVGGLEVRLTWRPPLRAMYHEWTLRGELLALQ